MDVIRYFQKPVLRIISLMRQLAIFMIQWCGDDILQIQN